MMRLLTCLAVLITLSCSQKVSVLNGQSDTISGKVTGLSTSSTNSVMSSCASETVKLFNLNDVGAEGELIAEARVSSNGQFTFKNLISKGVQLSPQAQKVKYLLRFTCGAEALNRYVTGINGQNVDYGSTLLSWFAYTNESSKLKDIPPSNWTQLYNQLQTASSVQEAYTIAATDSMIASTVAISGLDVSALNDAAPILTSTTVPASFSEESSNTLTALAHHWSPSYSMAFEWRLNGQLLANTISHNYIPSAQSQGTYTLQFFLGQNNGSGLVDTSKPYVQKVFTAVVNNTVPPTAPILTRLSPMDTNSTAQSLRISTGAVHGSTFYNCRSFTNLALVEESAFLPALPPTNHGLYTLSCTTATHQDIPYTSSGTEGPRALRLWAMDASGAVSALGQEVLFNYDTTAPSLAFTTPNAHSVFHSGTTVTGSCETGLTVTLAGTGINPTTATCTNSAFIAPVTFTSGEGSKTVTISQTDTAGNTSTQSRSFVKDSLAPALTFSAPASMTIAVSGLSISGTCEDGLTVTVGGSGALGSTTTCSSGTFTTAIGFSNGDGNKVIEISQTDAAGNTGTSSRMFVRDTTPPALTFTSPAANTETTGNITVTGTCETGLTVNISGAGVAPNTASCASGVFSRSIVLTGGDGPITVIAEQTDSVGNSGQTQRDYIRDSTAPTAVTLVLNSGDLSTGNRNVLVHLQATSPRNDISAFCLRLDNSAPPAADDGCWTTLSSLSLPLTNTLNIPNYPFQIGSLLGTYIVRVWFKDAIGNISVNTSSAIDMDDISYQPDPPPVISNATLTNTDSFTEPLTTSETTALLNSDIYIKWNASDNNALPSGAITLHYTENDSTYTQIATNLNNGANGGCTVTVGMTGCVRLTASSPLSTYYKIRVTVKDSGDYITMATTNAANTAKFVSLSGNTSLGLGGSASSAILIGRNEAAFVDYFDSQALAVTKKGEIFFNYLNRGLAYISPTTGMVTLIGTQTGTSSGDNGLLANATFNNIRRIVLDHQDNLLIWDNNYVRYVDLSQTPHTIVKLFGGGADASDGAPAASASVPTLTDNYALFTPVPNGRVYYEIGRQIWYYDPTDQRVRLHLTLSGTGALGYPSFTWSACASENTAIAFDKTTSAITKIIRRAKISNTASCGNTPGISPQNANFDVTTGIATAPHPQQTVWSSKNFAGLDGKIYALQQQRVRLIRYNPSTNQYEGVIGNSAGNGRCSDSTPANTCRAVIMSAFINEFGRPYVLDMGVIRTLDDSGLVQTIAGQPRNYGIGEPPTSARYSQINFFSVSGNDVYVVNKLENQIVKFSLLGGNLEHIAGSSALGSPSHNGVAKTSALANCGWAMPCGLIVDGTSQRLYYNVGSKFSYLNLATGLWNVSATDVQDTSARISYLGMRSDRLIAYVPSHFGSTGNKVTIREIASTGADTRIYGQDAILTSLSNQLCDNMDPLTCTLAHTNANNDVQTQIKHDSSTNNWLVGYYNRNYVNTLPVGGGITHRVITTTNTIAAFDFKYNGPDMILYYCAVNGNLYKRNITTGVETALPLPSSTIRCDGLAVHYHAGRDSLLFIYKQNDMFGIAEYTNP